MEVKFYVNGMCVDTYRCDAHIEYSASGAVQVVGLTPKDELVIEHKKRKAYINYGYPATLKFEEAI